MKKAQLNQILRVAGAATGLLLFARNLESTALLCGLVVLSVIVCEIFLFAAGRHTSNRLKTFILFMSLSSLAAGFQTIAAKTLEPEFADASSVFSIVMLFALLLVWGKADGTLRFKLRMRSLLYFTGIMFAGGLVRSIAIFNSFQAAPFFVVSCLLALFFFLHRKGLA